jgi:hypothetical protein
MPDNKDADFLKAVITQFIEKGQTLDFQCLAKDAGLLNLRAAQYRWSKLKGELGVGNDKAAGDSQGDGDNKKGGEVGGKKTGGGGKKTGGKKRKLEEVDDDE